MVKAELGIKRTCPSCAARFYDLLKNPIVCPKCGTNFVAGSILPSKSDLPPAVTFVVPACGTPAADAQIAADANIQLAGLAYDGGLSAVDGEIVSMFHTASADAEDQTIVAPLETLQRLYATDAVTYVAGWLHDAADAAAVASDLRARLGAHGIAASVYTYEDYDVNPYYVGSMQFIASLVTFIGVLVVAVVVLGVFNATTLTVFERTREIGTFRALGYRRRQVKPGIPGTALVEPGAAFGII